MRKSSPFALEIVVVAGVGLLTTGTRVANNHNNNNHNKCQRDVSCICRSAMNASIVWIETKISRNDKFETKAKCK